MQSRAYPHRAFPCWAGDSGNALRIGLFLGALIGIITACAACVHQSLGGSAALRRADVLRVQVEQLYQEGKYAEALSRAREVLEIRQMVYGPAHPDGAEAYNTLAVIYQARGNYDAAQPLYVRALAIWEKSLGVEHSNVATVLNNLAALHREQGNHDAAEPLYRRALAIWKKTLGLEHPQVATALNNLAALYREQGNYDAAEPLYRRALGIWEKSLGAEHSNVATVLNNLAALYHAQGNYDAAEPLYERALLIWKKTLGLEHPIVASLLNNLAALHHAWGNPGVAESLYWRVLAVWKKTLGLDHPHVATVLDNLAALHREQGNYWEAQLLMDIRQGKRLGRQYPAVAAAFDDLLKRQNPREYADLDYMEYEQLSLRELVPEAVVRRAPSVGGRVGSSKKPRTSDSSEKSRVDATPEPVKESVQSQQVAEPEAPPRKLLNQLLDTRKAMARAVGVESHVERAREPFIGRMIAARAEREKIAVLDRVASDMDRSLLLAAEFDAPDAHYLAMTHMLRRKARALGSLAGNLAAMRSHPGPAEQELLDEYQQVSTLYATSSLRGPGDVPAAQHGQRLAALARRRQKLEKQIARHSETLGKPRAPVTLEVIQAALPPDAALVEWARHACIAPATSTSAGQASKPRRTCYAACVVHARSGPTCVALGEATAIEAKVEALRNAIAVRATDAFAHARALDARIMAPVREHLSQDARQVFLSPDGALNLVPFAALMDEQERFLVEHYELTYLTSGTELVHRPAARPRRSAPLVLADPDYGTPGSGAAAVFRRLPGFAREARSVGAALPGATVLTGPQATEARLKAAHGPWVLHLTTHGGTQGPGCMATPAATPGAPGNRSLATQVRAGIALANANACQSPATVGQSAQDDGWLSALEVAALDLHGTRLVALSACETGVGNSDRSAGIYGLRRALVLAGAETHMVSLWSVSDGATSYLMEAYYRNLQQGAGRSEAMRQVQLEMLADPMRRHPFFWASFIVSGDPAPLE